VSANANSKAEIAKTRRLVSDVHGVAQSRWPVCSVWWDHVEGGTSAEICVGDKKVFPKENIVAPSGSDALLHLLNLLLALDEGSPS
jgi:hypothetical protein